MAYEIKFGPGDKVHARVMSQREQRDADGNQLFSLDGGKTPFAMQDSPQQTDQRRNYPGLLALMEDFVWREFDGEVLEVFVSADHTEYSCTHDDADTRGPYRVVEKWLTPR